MFKFRNRLLLTFAVLLLVVTSAVPLMAQEPATRAGFAIITGEIEYTDGQLIVDGYVIYPFAGFVAEDFPEGTPVIIVGTLNPDGSVVALAVEPFSDDIDDEDDVCDPAVDECDPPVCDPAVDDCEPEVCDPALEDCDVEVCDPEVEDCDDEDAGNDEQYGACGMESHPAGMKIADAYSVAYEDVMDLFCGGYGFGEIMIALKLADGDEEFFDELIALRDSGEGWGNVKKYAYANKNQNGTDDETDDDDSDESLTLPPGPLARERNANANNGGGRPDNPGNSGNSGNNGGGRPDNPGNSGNNGNNGGGRPSSPGNSGNAGKGGNK